MRCIRYPLVKQEGISDCGVACLLMIIKYYGGYVDIETLREMTNTDRTGVSAYNLIEASKKLNFEAYGIKCSLDEIGKSKVILPCIAHVVIHDTYQHYVVIYNINYKKKKIIIGDPNGWIKKMSFEEFENIWHGILIILFPVKTIPLINKSTPYNNLLIPILLDNKHYLILIFLLSIILTIFGIASSFFVKYMLEAINNSNKANIYAIVLIFMVIYFIKIVTDFYRNKLFIFLNQKIDSFLTLDTFKYILHLPYRYYRNHATGDIISRFDDIQIIRTVIGKLVISIFVDLPLTIISAFFLYMISPTLLVISLIILLLYVITILIFKHLFTNIINESQEQKALVTSTMIETINGFETVKGLGLEDNMQKNYEHKYVSLLKKIYHFDNLYNYQYLVKEIINTSGFLVTIFIGSLTVLDGKLSVANLILFNTLLTNFLTPIRNIIDLDTNYKEASNALKRIYYLKNYPQEHNGHISKQITGKINIKHLNYSYNNEKKILSDINLDIKVGEKVLLLGTSGSGKSTLLKLLMRYYETNRESIFLDNVDINDYDINTLKNNISYIAQQEILFTDSLYNNIVLRRKVTDDEFLEVTKLCRINEIIASNNAGYNLYIEENGFNLSGGEKQRIILARTLLSNFNILLIDEGLNQVDINLERKILKDLFANFTNKTVIIISHRLDNMDLFDRVIELSKGVIKRNDYKNG